MVGLRIAGVIAMIAFAAVIVQVTSTLPWQVDALIALAAVVVWAYLFENEAGDTNII